jgi:hypothetical protein
MSENDNYNPKADGYHDGYVCGFLASVEFLELQAADLAQQSKTVYRIAEDLKKYANDKVAKINPYRLMPR